MHVGSSLSVSLTRLVDTTVVDIIIIAFCIPATVYIQVVQEYERAVIFRLGRIVAGGAKGPGESA